MKKIVYVTGCLGFIGSHFTRKCLNLGWLVYGIDKKTYAANLDVLQEFLNYQNFVFEQKDIKDITFIPDCDYIVNFAAESHVENSIANSDNFINSNILGVRNLLEVLRYKNSNCVDVPLFCHVSSDEVYGDIAEGKHVETDLLKPSNPYSAAKAAADMLVLAWSRTYNLNYVIVRPTNNYGTHQYPEKLIPITVYNLVRGRKTKLHNKGTPIRSWLHVQDTADAIFTILSSDIKNQIYNIAGSCELSNLTTVENILSCYFNLSKGQINFSDYIDDSLMRQGQDMRYSLNDEKLRALGWTPKKEFSKEIKHIVSFYKSKFNWWVAKC